MEKLWFYARYGSTEKQGPVAEAEMRKLITNGAVSAPDLVWSEGMSDWMPLNSIPELQSGVPAIPAVGTPLPDGLAGWLGFLAIMSIVTGAFLVFTCVGLVTGVLTILAGSSLLACKNALAQVQTVDAAIAPFFDKLKTYAQLMGIIGIIGIIGLVIGIFFWFSMFATMIGAIGSA